ncbi:MAG TPA: gamma-glutamyl-gamma-aminobutyrate hydrolase family protein [Candidatus Eisenbacteria bacterium]
MAKPLIGITPNIRPTRTRGDGHFVLSTYVRMVARAGAIPLIVPIVATREEAREVLDRLDAIVLTGGGDLDPAMYGQTTRRPELLAPPERVASDFAYAAAAEAEARPTLGICLGCQILNVAGGGTLFQHIPEDLPGAGEHEDDEDGVAPEHEIALEAGSRLRAIAGVDRAVVNSYHHQSIAEPGRGFSLAARGQDGVIEAIERPELPFHVGVQWHPERMPDAALTRRLMAALVDAARGAPSRRG